MTPLEMLVIKKAIYKIGNVIRALNHEMSSAGYIVKNLEEMNDSEKKARQMIKVRYSELEDSERELRALLQTYEKPNHNF